MTPSGPNGRASPDGGPPGRESRPAGARADEEGPGVVVAPETSDERRSRTIRRLLVGTAVAAAAIGGYYLWGGDAVERIGRPQESFAGQASAQIDPMSGSSTERGSGRVASGDSGDSAAGDSAPPGPEGAGVSASDDSAVRGFWARAEELLTAAERYRERSQDFRLGRIGCSDLAEGYVAVDRAMVDMAGTYLDARDQLGADEEELYRRAMARADSIGRIFDRSGCERDF